MHPVRNTEETHVAVATAAHAQTAPITGGKRIVKSAVSQARDYSQLLKLRINALVVASAWCGAHMAAVKSGSASNVLLLNALAGIGAVAAGTAAMNQVIERRVDAMMQRTRNRPVVTGRISATTGCVIATVLIVGGTGWLWAATNAMAALLTLLTSILYIGAYTPLKRRSPICTTIGAIPGALPPLLGWVAVRGRVDIGAVVLFAILFCWQFPHFYSIAVLYREDYARAGIRMLPVVSPDGNRTAFQIMIFSLALLGVTVLPSVLHMAGWPYMGSAAVLGFALLYPAWLVWRSRKLGLPLPKAPARLLLQASVIYLPILLSVMVLDAR